MMNSNWFIPFSWIMVALSFVTSLIINPLLGVAGPPIVFFSAIPLVLVHGCRRYGLKNMTIFLVVTFVFSTFWETMSIHTGFPFGHYHYTMKPQFPGGVPILIPVAYISLSYICWHVANAILGEMDTKLNKISAAFVLATLASVVMTVYDLATDSMASTLNQSWIWEQGGALFGVPVSNYLGWWFCTFTFYLTFSLILLRKKSQEAFVKSDRLSVLQFILIYGNLGITVFVAKLIGYFGPGVVIDPAGTSWNRGDLGGAMLLFVVFGMFVLVFLALINLFRIGR
ncbi:MAG: carotenoid biosynthesis protein [Pseudomonadota bacterium]